MVINGDVTTIIYDNRFFWRWFHYSKILRRVNFNFLRGITSNADDFSIEGPAIAVEILFAVVYLYSVDSST